MINEHLSGQSRDLRKKALAATEKIINLLLLGILFYFDNRPRWNSVRLCCAWFAHEPLTSVENAQKPFSDDLINLSRMWLVCAVLNFIDFSRVKDLKNGLDSFLMSFP
jgi:hypothetical protein